MASNKCPDEPSVDEMDDIDDAASDITVNHQPDGPHENQNHDRNQNQSPVCRPSPLSFAAMGPVDEEANLVLDSIAAAVSDAHDAALRFHDPEAHDALFDWLEREQNKKSDPFKMVQCVVEVLKATAEMLNVLPPLAPDDNSNGHGHVRTAAAEVLVESVIHTARLRAVNRERENLRLLAGIGPVLVDDNGDPVPSSSTPVETAAYRVMQHRCHARAVQTVRSMGVAYTDQAAAMESHEMRKWLLAANTVMHATPYESYLPAVRAWPDIMSRFLPKFVRSSLAVEACADWMAQEYIKFAQNTVTSLRELHEVDMEKKRKRDVELQNRQNQQNQPPAPGRTRADRRERPRPRDNGSAPSISNWSGLREGLRAFFTG